MDSLAIDGGRVHDVGTLNKGLGTVKRTLTVLALIVAVFMPAEARATLPSDPVATCPGDQGSSSAQTAMFCAAVQPSRAEGPYFVNYVDVVDGSQAFCHLERRGTGSLECHPYWPFVNPTVNAYLAPQSAFTSKRLVATKEAVDGMRSTMSEKDQTIARQARKIERLKHRIERLRHRR